MYKVQYFTPILPPWQSSLDLLLVWPIYEKNEQVLMAYSHLSEIV